MAITVTAVFDVATLSMNNLAGLMEALLEKLVFPTKCELPIAIR